MKTQTPRDWTLLIVDGQNDFCDLTRAALPVPGATADLRRIAQLIRRHSKRIHSLVATLDSHPQVAIERVNFWQQGSGAPVAPFTHVTLEQVQRGELTPRDPAMRTAVCDYLQALQARGRTHTLWPVHCVLGTWGHALYAPLARAIAAWEESAQRPALKVLKGLNPLTEQFSAVRAEVPCESDPSTQANQALLAAVRPRERYLLVAGEAASHCVPETVRDLTADYSPEELQRVILLTDGMSTIPGCEALTAAFLKEMASRGVRSLTCAEAARLPALTSLS